MKIWTRTETKDVKDCYECPECIIEEDTVGIEAYTVCCKTNHLEYSCGAKDIKMGVLDWKNGKWVGSFTGEIPDWCPLEDKL